MRQLCFAQPWFTTVCRDVAQDEVNIKMSLRRQIEHKDVATQRQRAE